MFELDQKGLDAKKEEITTQIKENPIMLYMKGSKVMPQCGFSAQVIHILTQIGHPFETKDVLEDDYLRSAIKEYSDWPTIPQLYISGEFVGGCDIITELFQSGELSKLIQEATAK